MADAVAILARTPATLDALLRGRPDDWIAANEGGDTWSPFDVIGHLIHVERTNWMPRARFILEHGDARTFDTLNRLAQFAESEGRKLASLLDEFATLRRQSLSELKTLRQLLATWVAHDLDHVMQISRVLARQYSDEVGPWRAYLRIIGGTQG